METEKGLPREEPSTSDRGGASTTNSPSEDSKLHSDFGSDSQLLNLPHADIDTPDAMNRLFNSAVGDRRPCILCGKTVPSFGIFTPYRPLNGSGTRCCTVYWLCEKCSDSPGSRDRIDRKLDQLPWYAGAIRRSTAARQLL